MLEVFVVDHPRTRPNIAVIKHLSNTLRLQRILDLFLAWSQQQARTSFTNLVTPNGRYRIWKTAGFPVCRGFLRQFKTLPMLISVLEVTIIWTYASERIGILWNHRLSALRAPASPLLNIITPEDIRTTTLHNLIFRFYLNSISTRMLSLTH